VPGLLGELGVRVGCEEVEAAAGVGEAVEGDGVGPRSLRDVAGDAVVQPTDAARHAGVLVGSRMLGNREIMRL
jgi:hypothetical protein